ncbi:MAG: hypothetical protein QXJ72_06900 [Thermoproteota archaeon]
MISEEHVEKIITAVSNMITLVFILSLFSDLLGISLFELFQKLVTTPWIIPVEIIERYWFIWYGMEWVMLFAIAIDWWYSQWYYSKYKETPSPTYTLCISTLVFAPSIFLFAITHKTLFAFLIVFGGLSMLNASFKLKR